MGLKYCTRLSIIVVLSRRIVLPALCLVGACELRVVVPCDCTPTGGVLCLCGVRVRPCGGNLQVEVHSWRQRLKIVAGRSSHPSRCRWTAGERVSSRDTRDILVSELHLVGSLECRSQAVLGQNEQPSQLENLGSVSSQSELNEIYRAVRVITAHRL